MADPEGLTPTFYLGVGLYVQEPPCALDYLGEVAGGLPGGYLQCDEGDHAGFVGEVLDQIRMR